VTAEAIVAVSAAVVALTQLVKWGGVHDRWGPFAVLALSLMGVLFWGWSKDVLSRAAAFEFFVGWIAVATSAAGVFGFTRASSEAVTRTTAPPIGAAGGNPTTPPVRRIGD
jgi:hypothetical protein